MPPRVSRLLFRLGVGGSGSERQRHNFMNSGSSRTHWQGSPSARQGTRQGTRQGIFFRGPVQGGAFRGPAQGDLGRRRRCRTARRRGAPDAALFTTRPVVHCSKMHAHEEPLFREPVSVPMVLRNRPGLTEAPPGVDVGKREQRAPEEDRSTSKEYVQWVAVVVVAAADGTAAHKKPTATGQMRKLNTGWFLVRYEDDCAEEWLRLLARRPGIRGQWRYRGQRQ